MVGTSKVRRLNLKNYGLKSVALAAPLGITAALLLLPEAPAAAPASAIAMQAQSGEALFKAKCQMCHSAVAGKKSAMGPNLYNVVGRKAGASDYAAYSPKLKAYGKAWTPELLDQWLLSPTKTVPGTRMVVAVPDARQRKEITAYLMALK